MPALEFFGASVQDADNVGANATRLINCYREPAGQGGRTGFVLKSFLGQTLFCDLADFLGRSLIEVNDTLYAASGGSLYSVNQAGAATLLGVIADDDHTGMAGYQTNVMIAAGGLYFVYDGDTVTAVSGGAFTSVQDVTFLGGWTILAEKDGSKIEWTELQDPATRNAAYVATAEARDDKILRVKAVAGLLYIFKTSSIEIWYQTGAAGVDAFARLSDGVIDIGLLGKGLVAEVRGGLFFVGSDGAPYMLRGNELMPLFNGGVQTSIENNSPTHCVYFEDRAHKFCVIRFSDRPAWVFDVVMNEWAERATGNNFDAWDAVATAKAYGKWHTINASAIVAQLERTNQDLGATMIRRAISNTLAAEEPFCPTVEIETRRGHYDGATLIASFSDDGGETWSPPDHRVIGALGEYDRKAVWYEGQFDSLTMRVDIADAAEVPVYTRAKVAA